MKARIFSRPVGHQDWLKARRCGLTGTDIAAIVGESRYRSALSVYLDKLHPEMTLGTDENEAMWLGKQLEDPVAKIWVKKNPTYKIRRVNAVLQHESKDWILGNIDRQIVKPEKGVLEIKIAGPGTMGRWDEDDLPDDYYLQVMWYLIVTGLPYAKVVGLLGSTKLVERHVEYDADLAKDLIAAGETFWHDNVLQRVPPAIDASNSTKEALERLFAEPLPVSIDVPAAAEWIARRADAKRAADIYTEAQKEAENNLRMLLGHSEVGVCGGCEVSWKPQTRRTIDTERLKKDYPDIYEAYTKVNTFRKLHIKGEV